jgi:hypothetical protein
VHRHAALGQRQCDAAGADGQLQCAPAARQLGEQADRRVNGFWLEHAIRRVVVARRNRLTEVSVWIIHELRTYCARTGAASRFLVHRRMHSEGLNLQPSDP